MIWLVAYTELLPSPKWTCMLTGFPCPASIFSTLQFLPGSPFLAVVFLTFQFLLEFPFLVAIFLAFHSLLPSEVF